MGVLNCGVQHENDPAYALLYEFVEKPDATIRIGAIMGLGLAYAGVPRRHSFTSRSDFGLGLAAYMWHLLNRHPTGHTYGKW